MLDPRGADYTIWVVALLLYVGDAARLMSPRELMLVEAGRARFMPVFSDNPVTLMGRVLAFAPLLLPHRGVFVAPWGRAWAGGAQLKAMLQSLQALRDSLGPARIVAAWAFTLLFVVGPALTFALGPSAAVLYTAVLVYPSVVVAIVIIWRKRRAFGLTATRALLLGVEILVCPAFVPNLVRKITGAHGVDVDGAQILVATASRDVKERFLGRLQLRAEELMHESARDAAVQAELRSYLATVRGARWPITAADIP